MSLKELLLEDVAIGFVQAPFVRHRRGPNVPQGNFLKCAMVRMLL